MSRYLIPFLLGMALSVMAHNWGLTQELSPMLDADKAKGRAQQFTIPAPTSPRPLTHPGGPPALMTSPTPSAAGRVLRDEKGNPPIGTVMDGQALH